MSSFQKSNKKSKIAIPDIRTLEGFRQIYEEHGLLVNTVCRQYIDDRDACEDLKDIIILYVWERRNSLNIRGSIEGYLYQAAKWQVSEYFKLEKRRADRLQKAAEKLGLLNVTVENEVWYQDFLEQLENAIESLPPKRKKVFTLVKLEGLSVKMASQKLSLAETTINTHLYKALSELKVKLADYGTNSRFTGS
ncbi:MAG: RNA polymerase sigma factor [Cyclobacteriaceae bacterium]